MQFKVERFWPCRSPAAMGAGLLAWCVATWPGVAEAHVKWFCDFNVASQPQTLQNVLTSQFAALSVLAVCILLIGCLVDQTPFGAALSAALDRVTAPIRANADVLVRAACGFFLIALWTWGGILLTPELKTDSPLIPLLQLGMAASLISPRTAPFAGFGIVGLYGLALRQYGLFHLMDYPIFLGVAAYLVLTCRPQWNVLEVRPLEVLRWSASITLMWASIEKWAYPQWTLPLYLGHPAMSLGYNFDLFMRAAGVIEFTLAFALLWTPLVRRSAATILIGMFVSATFEFGKIDVVGHSVIIAVLLVLAADNVTRSASIRAWRSLIAPTLGYGLALAAFLATYYGVHAILFGTTLT